MAGPEPQQHQAAPRDEHAACPDETVPAKLPVPFAGPLGPSPAANLQPARVLMGPGPSVAHPRVLLAQAQPLVGHMSAAMIATMDDVKRGLQYLFQTSSPYVLALSGTGHAGMECVLANLVEKHEEVLIAQNGIWGERAADMASRLGLNAHVLTAEPGTSFPIDRLVAEVRGRRPAALFVVAGESSTGAHQSLGDGRLGEACRDAGALLIVDTVASLGGVPFFGDAWGVDACYSGSQKCLSAPPGTAPLFLSARAWQKAKGRSGKCPSFCWDLPMLARYWGWDNENGSQGPRFYHHTGAVSSFYALREALAIVGEEEEGGGKGLQAMWARHARCARQLWSGLEKLGLEPYVSDPAQRLITVNTIAVPVDGEGKPAVDWAKVVAHALREYGVEIAGGLGPSAGKVWRVGLMGYSCTRANVALVLEAMRTGLEEQGWTKAGGVAGNGNGAAQA